jgi:8-oxo-dGTP pyrophosphatase MutT (NUDIX family)
MAREVSAGGVVIRRMRRQWWVAVIEPRRDANSGASTAKAREPVLALPKGLVDPGESPEQTAIREVREESGVVAAIITKLTDIKYFYVRTWGDGERVFKIVSFYLLQFERGRVGNITDDMRHEVQRAFWMPLQDAAQKLSYKGERGAVKLAVEYLDAHPELAEAPTSSGTDLD